MMLFNVFPCLAMSHPSRGYVGNSIAPADFGVRNTSRVITSYDWNVRIIQFGFMVSRAKWMYTSVFLLSIINIILICSKEQMVRIATWRVIAAMQNLQVVVNYSVSQFPRYSVSPLRFPLAFEAPITIGKSPSQPWPTGAVPLCFIYRIPKRLYSRNNPCETISHSLRIMRIAIPTMNRRIMATLYRTCFNDLSHRRDSFSSVCQGRRLAVPGQRRSAVISLTTTQNQLRSAV